MKWFTKLSYRDKFARQQWRCRHREWTCGPSGRRRRWDKLREEHGNIYITICEIDTKWEFAGSSTQSSETTQGWMEREMRAGSRETGQMSIGGWFLWLIHVAVGRKPAQYCKAIILQSKKRGGIFFLIESQGECLERKKIWWVFHCGELYLQRPKEKEIDLEIDMRFGLDTHTGKVLVVNIIKPLNCYNESLLHSFILDQNL